MDLRTKNKPDFQDNPGKAGEISIKVVSKNAFKAEDLWTLCNTGIEIYIIRNGRYEKLNWKWEKEGLVKVWIVVTVDRCKDQTLKIMYMFTRNQREK